VQMRSRLIPFHPTRRSLKYSPPAGAVDAHNHVSARKPVSVSCVPRAKYTPCAAPKENLFALHYFFFFFLGF